MDLNELEHGPEVEKSGPFTIHHQDESEFYTIKGPGLIDLESESIHQSIEGARVLISGLVDKGPIEGEFETWLEQGMDLFKKGKIREAMPYLVFALKNGDTPLELDDHFILERIGNKAHIKFDDTILGYGSLGDMDYSLSGVAPTFAWLHESYQPDMDLETAKPGDIVKRVKIMMHNDDICVFKGEDGHYYVSYYNNDSEPNEVYIDNDGETPYMCGCEVYADAIGKVLFVATDAPELIHQKDEDKQRANFEFMHGWAAEQNKAKEGAEA